MNKPYSFSNEQMNGIVELTYSNIIKECENFEEFFGVAKDKCENIWSEADIHWIANYVWKDYWSKY